IEQERVDRGRDGSVLLPKRTLHPLPPRAPPGLVRVDRHVQRRHGEDEHYDPTHRQPLTDGCWPHRSSLAVSRPTSRPVVPRHRPPTRALAPYPRGPRGPSPRRTPPPPGPAPVTGPRRTPRGASCSPAIAA